VLKDTRRGLDLLILTRNHSTLEFSGWIWIQVGESQCLGERVSKSYCFGAGRKKITVGRQGGINTLRSRSAMVTFESPEPPGWIPEPLGTGDFSRLTREQPETSGKNSKVPGKVFSRLRQLADRSFVPGTNLVLELTISTWFHPCHY
jgi:hypothetical protein